MVPGDSTAFGVDSHVTDWAAGELGLVATGGTAVTSTAFGREMVIDPMVWTSPTGRVWSGVALDTGLDTAGSSHHWAFRMIDVAVVDDVVLVVGNASPVPDLAAVARGQVPADLPDGFYFGYGGLGPVPYLFGPGGVPVLELAFDPGLDGAVPAEAHHSIAWRARSLTSGR